MNHFEHFLFVEYLRNKNRRLLKYYNPHCVEPNYNRKYLYFASSYQPEAVTDLHVGHYTDLFLVLDILSSVIPDDSSAVLTAEAEPVIVAIDVALIATDVLPSNVFRSAAATAVRFDPVVWI